VRNVFQRSAGAQARRVAHSDKKSLEVFNTLRLADVLAALQQVLAAKMSDAG